MRCSKDKPSILTKKDWLEENPIYQNEVVCDDVYKSEYTLSNLHLHEFIEVSLVISGSGLHRIWNETVECKKGDIYILNTGVPHGFFAKNDIEKPTVCNIIFDIQAFFEEDVFSPNNDRFCYGIFRKNPLVANKRLNLKEFKFFENIYNLISEEISKKESEWLEVTKSQLKFFLIKFMRSLDDESNKDSSLEEKENTLITLTMHYIMENYSKSDFTLETVAKNLYISKAHLSKLFYRISGEHFSDYIRNVRIKQACKLLQSTRLTNEEIVYRCGLKDIQSFYKIFKSTIGMTPYQYRVLQNTYNKGERI